MQDMVSIVNVVRCERLEAYHGIPISICCCTTMNQALIPSTVAAPARTIKIHRLSWISGQW
jgi:hypothetical protein